MLRCSNVLLGFLNIIIFLLSLPIVGYGIWLAVKNSSECDKILASPVVIIGVCLMFFSLIGICGACCRSSGMMCLYLTLMTLIIVVLIVFAGFVLVVTHKAKGDTLTGEVHVKSVDYSHWLARKVDDSSNWKKIKSCMIDMKVCTSFANKRTNETVQKFYAQHLTSIQSGCCKPSDDCKFRYEGPINWNKANGDYKNPDCTKWENTVDTLCYNCQSCKAGLINQIKGKWKIMAISNASILGLLVIFYILGCCACSNNRSRKNRSKSKSDDMYNPFHNPYHYPQKGNSGGTPGGPRGAGGAYP